MNNVVKAYLNHIRRYKHLMDEKHQKNEKLHIFLLFNLLLSDFGTF